MDAEQLREFNAAKADTHRLLFRTLVRFGTREFFIPFCSRLTVEEMERFGFRTDVTGVASLPDSENVAVAAGDTFVEVVGNHTWRIEQIIANPAEAARKLLCRRLDP